MDEYTVSYNRVMFIFYVTSKSFPDLRFMIGHNGPAIMKIPAKSVMVTKVIREIRAVFVDIVCIVFGICWSELGI